MKADEYRGPNQIRIGDGLGLTLKHIGSTQGRTLDFKLGGAGEKRKKKIKKIQINIHIVLRKFQPRQIHKNHCFLIY